jgi:ribosomal protein S12 methylthiotransferase accessory factor
LDDAVSRIAAHKAEQIAERSLKIGLLEHEPVSNRALPMADAEIRPAFLEVDLASEQGRALLRAVSDRYGSPIVRAADLASRMFLLRSPWAPGLRFIGAETKSRALNGGGSAQVSFSLSGSGEQLEEAFASCVGEGIDRLAQIECPGDVTTIASLPEIADRVWPSAIEAIEQDMLNQALSEATPLAWIAAKALDTGHDFDNEREVLLPADWCLRRAADERCLKPRTALSVGVAAGPSFDWAASRALLELIERDAASLWWIGGRRGRTVPLDEPAVVEVTKLLDTLRQQTKDRASWLLDITTDIKVPVIVALSCDRDGRQLAYGLAARLSIAEAARAAILELCQTELAILLAKIKRAEIGDEKLLPNDRAHLERDAMISADRCELLHPLGVQSVRHETVGVSDLSTIVRALAHAGIAAALIDLTRPEFDIPVVRAVAPALQPMPSDIVTDRLQRKIRDFGGGARFNGGIALMI